MSLADIYSNRLRGLTLQLRIALAAECGRRVLPLYEEYWVGTYYESVAQSVDIGWKFACGETVSKTEIVSNLSELQDVVEFYNEESISVLSNATTVILRLLQCFDKDEVKSLLASGRAFVSTLGAAQSAEAMANRGGSGDSKKMAMAEEESWQNEAIKIAEAWQGPCRRNMFNAAGPQEPAWLVDWRLRSKRD